MTITKHAYEKARERFKWKNKVLDKMAEKAFNEGTPHSDTKSRLNKYISHKWFMYKQANNVKIYGENIFFFKDDILITLYRLPQELIKYTKV